MGLKHAVQQIYVQEGYRGFFRGVTASVIQIIPYMGLMFGSYEFLKKLFRELEVNLKTYSLYSNILIF